MHIRAHKHLIQFLLKDAITTREKKNISFNPNLTVVLLGFCHKVLITLFSLHKYLSFFCVAALCRLANVLLLIFFLFRVFLKLLNRSMHSPGLDEVSLRVHHFWIPWIFSSLAFPAIYLRALFMENPRSTLDRRNAASSFISYLGPSSAGLSTLH